MKPVRLYAMLAAVLVFASMSFAQEMSKDQWQQDMNHYTQLRNEMQTKLQSLTNEVTALQAQSTQADADIKKCMDELYGLVGSDAQKAEAYRAEISAAEQTANELMRLSDADLYARKGDVDALAAKVKSLRQNKLSLIPEFSDRLDALDQSVASLQKTIAAHGTADYTVRGGDCLWNIAKKKDTYNNAWLWPKIWQGNTDKIKNPDLIYPKQKLSIPAGSALTPQEKSAVNKYYVKKRQGGA